jgi:hypothetical protein
MFDEGNIDLPRTLPLFPANDQSPKERFHSQYLLILCLISFNRVGNDSHHNQEPIDMHRFTPREYDDAHHLCRYFDRSKGV